MKEIWLFSERRLFSLKTLFATQGRTLIQRSPMSECQGFEEFETRFGQDAAAELLERICDASWSQSKKPPTPGLVLTSVHEHNAANHTLCGHIEHGGEVFHFVIDNGDWAGTVVREFGPEDRVPEYEPPAPAQYMFVPRDDSLETRRPGIYRVYLAWTQEAWFKEKLAAYHYDRRVQPGHAIEQHYAQWAHAKGLKIVCVN